MRLIAFVEGRPKPQPRSTQQVKFLFSKPAEDWAIVDSENKRKSELGLLKKDGKPYKPTRFADRRRRLDTINSYREMVYNSVSEQTKGNIPTQNLFFFYLFRIPKNWSKKKKRAFVWQFHVLKPDYSNLLKGVEDCLYKKDSECNAVAHYKLYIPDDFPEGLLILHDEEIHRYVIDTGIDFLKKHLNKED